MGTPEVDKLFGLFQSITLKSEGVEYWHARQLEV